MGGREPSGGEGDRAALDRRLAELERAQRDQDEFLGFAAHELKTPVTSIEGYAFLLARDGASGAEATRQRCLDGITRNSARLVALVGELLEIGRARAGRLELRAEELDLAELVRGAATADQDVAGRAETEVGSAAVKPSVVEVRSEGGAARVRGDRRRLAALVRDMISDAVERAALTGSPGGVVRVAVESRDGEALVSVSDAGRPTARDVLERGFLGLRRTGGVERGGRGGLGLAVGREAVLLLGGRCFVDSGAGNTLGFALPIVAPA